MGKVNWLQNLVEVFSFRSSTNAGKGEASALHNSPTILKVLTEEDLSTMSASELKQYARALRQVADGLEKLASTKTETPAYPNFCSDLYDHMKESNKRFYIDELMKKLGKTENTVRTEISHLRKAGIDVQKKYVKRSRKFKYFLAEAA